MIRNLLSKLVTIRTPAVTGLNSIIQKRCYGKLLQIFQFKFCFNVFSFVVAAPKKFYKNASILLSDGKYEITLDQRKLKTPKGMPFTVESEPLALAISHEWNSQSVTVERSRMMLTALANTALDNPNHLKKLDIINYLLSYAETDTVLFHNEAETDLFKLQTEHWDPLIEWFNKRYDTKLAKTTDISPPVYPENAKMQIVNYLKSYNLETLHGIQFAVETIKSLILAFACIDRFISPDQAVLLSRLEEEYQLGHWGRVEWAHDLSQQDLQSRLAASVFYVHCNTFSHKVKAKMVN